MEYQHDPELLRQLNVLREEVARLQRAMQEGLDQFIAEKKASGWRAFEFFSSYYGSHSEYGEGDEREQYLFHPQVDISRWEEVCFGHGHHGECDENKAFREWLGALADDQYVAW